jgi:hypothetical protein
MADILEKILEVKIDPEVYIHLLPHQVVHVQNLVYALRTNGAAVDMSDTGSGKSYSTGAICRVEGVRPLFIGPKAGIPNLYAVCEKFGIHPLGNVNYETIKNSKYYDSLESFHSETRVECPYVEVIRVQERNSLTKKLMFTPAGKPKMKIDKIIWKLPPNTVVVFDEAHKGRNGETSKANTANSKLMISLKSYLDRSHKIYGLFLSATLTDKLDNFDVIAYLLGFYRPYQPKIYKQFLRRFGVKGDEILKKIHKLLFPKYASRMSIRAIKEDTGNSIFRNNDVRAVMYPVDEQTAREIEENHMQIKNALENIRSHGISQGWGAIIRYWQRIEVLKVPSVAAAVFQSLQEGKAVVIFINFTETKKLLVDHILELAGASTDTSVEMSVIDFIDGDQNASQRDEVVTAFQENRINLLVCQIKAGGIAISLHDLHGKQRISYTFPTWSATDLRQALGRIYRANAKTDAIQLIPYCKYMEPSALGSVDKNGVSQEGTEEHEGKATLTIEETLCRNVNIKLEHIELINTGNLLDLQKIEIPDSVELE